MAIDCDIETLISFSDARSAFPGIKRRLSLATLHRWRLSGVRGVKLETILIGGLRFTSREAIARFIAAQNESTTPVTPGLTAQQRRRQSEAAHSELEKILAPKRPTKKLSATTRVVQE